MGKYIKKFEMHADYETYTASTEFIKPCVAFCVSGNDVHYIPNTDDPYRITFVDPEVERICVENFSSNGRYLTTEDAARVRYIDDVFKGNTAITSFDEFKYFTNVDTDYSFSGCTSLTSITLNENITKVYHSHFAKCNNLKKITILAETPPKGSMGQVTYGGYTYTVGPLSRGNLTYTYNDNRPIYIYVLETSYEPYEALDKSCQNNHRDSSYNWLCDGINQIRITD